MRVVDLGGERRSRNPPVAPVTTAIYDLTILLALNRMTSFEGCVRGGRWHRAWAKHSLYDVDSRSNLPIEAGSEEGRVLRWDAEGEAGGGDVRLGESRWPNGSADAAAYGVRAADVLVGDMPRPRPGVYAISVTKLTDIRKLMAHGVPGIDWLTEFGPSERLGHSIYIYEFF